MIQVPVGGLVVAHGVGGVRDLPVPTWLFYWGGAAVLAVSFAALGALWRRPQLAAHARGRPLPDVLSDLLLGPVRIAAQVVSVALLVLVFSAAAFGDVDPARNLAPTWIYVVFWLGLPVLSIVLGDVWRALSPWRALADAFVWVRESGGGEARPLAAYPERLGRWPGVVALFAFAALELAYVEPSSPRALAVAIALYSYVALFGMAAFGRDAWSGRGEAFAILFGLFARAAPLAVEAGRIRARPPLTGLAGPEPVPGTAAFVAVMLGTVAFDGYSRTAAWQDLVARIEAPYVVDRPGLGEVLASSASLAGMLAAVLLVAIAFHAACALARRTVRAESTLVPDFVLSLVPIAFVYEVAHYVSLLVVQGQFAVPLLSDPLGRGWDVLGTASVRPSLTVLSPNAIWYIQAGALLAGHVAGLAVAHDRTVDRLREPGEALRSQYAMLALMVLYTVGGLWLLSRG